MKLFCVTNFTEEKAYWKTVQESKIKPTGSAGQNFERLLLKGFAEQENLVVTACSFRLVPSFPGHNKILWGGSKEKLMDNISCIYLPFINLIFFKQICFSLGLVPEVIKWISRNRGEQKAILFTNISIPMVFLIFLLRLFLRCRVFVIVTDLQSLVLNYTKLSGIRNLLKYPLMWLSKIAEHRFDGYIFLTEHMNKVINRKNRPYIIVEGMADTKINLYSDGFKLKSSKDGVMYAGALHKQYGLELLIKGFMRTHNENIELWLFGAGDMEEEIIIYAKRDSRIKFFGMRPREEVIEYELNSVLLVNPRPSKQLFTKYSFPSKTLEYMATGTPLLTTRLPGIPLEYFDYTFVLDNETEDGMASMIESILQMPRKQLDDLGQRARQYVLENKNNVVQAKKIIDMIEMKNYTQKG